ncbi:hypothetical protein [Nonomuraea sp. NPDC050786]|uniref:hypothetical protein n=1 Tax=Nonomuraea sp. NPDC050786 TaxID=3154840 RepID=UPI0033CF5AF1
MPEPLLVEEVSHWWEVRTEEHRAVLRAWFADEGIDITDLTRVKVYLVDVPFAVLTFWVRDESGHLVLDEAMGAGRTRTETVLLSSLPPAEAMA